MSLYTVKQMAMRHESFSENALWNLVQNAEKYGFLDVVHRMTNPRKLLLCEIEFLKWVKIKSGKLIPKT